MKNLFWSLSTNFGLKIFSLLLNIYFANKIGVEEFGVYILLISVLSLIASFVEGGLSYSLIRKIGVTNKDYFSCILISYSFSFLGIVILIFASFYIEEINNFQSLLLVFLYLLGIPLYYNQLAFLERKMNFQNIFKIHLLAILLSSLFSLFFLYFNNNYLVPFSLFASQPIFFFILGPKKYIFNFFRHDNLFEISLVKEHFKFGKNILLGSVLNAAYNNFFNFFVNFNFSIRNLSIIERSKTYSELFFTVFGLSIGKVLYPKLCLFQNNKKEFIDFLTNYIVVGILFFLPITVLVSLIIEDVVMFLFKPEWWKISGYLKTLILCSFFSISAIFSQLAFRVLDRNYENLKNEFLKKTILILLIIISANISLDALIYSLAFGSVISFFLNLYFLNKILTFPFLILLKKIVLPIVVSFSTYFILVELFENIIINIIFYIFFYCLIIFFNNKKDIKFLVKENNL
tara:strand:+ start:2097 stop:3476 length:1380 start_codon:yes stop_codon:yes gene_type:complete